MNTNIIKSVVIFALGAAVGSIATLLLVKDKYERIANEEIASTKENYERRRNRSKQNSEASESEKQQEDREEKVLVYNRDRYKRIVRRYNGDTEISNALADPAEMEHPRDDEEDYREHERLSERANRRSSTGPYIITTEQFSEEMSHFDKLTIYYYEDDDTLVDENEQIICDVISIVGDEALDQFGNGSEDPEVVYVRNEKMQIDYEVIRLSKSYAQTVLGLEADTNNGRRGVRRRDPDEE
ncbi:MAG: hypothetical protein N2317_08635 [Syntrophales bacterium]|nr:hypothetical protein [Syntrophales bacterium]